jgi:hypothetical protein
MKIKHHDRAWKCPKCERWNKPKNLSGMERITKCRCGYKAIIRTLSVPVIRHETKIGYIKELK